MIRGRKEAVGLTKGLSLCQRTRPKSTAPHNYPDINYLGTQVPAPTKQRKVLFTMSKSNFCGLSGLWHDSTGFENK